mmetsp:Transcript_106803/g.300656  ORF Transcript_106803/g.300656 Transcript_106803/m.300656 type:complete len:367 (+) Transcript_106803:128-1228(+)
MLSQPVGRRGDAVRRAHSRLDALSRLQGGLQALEVRPQRGEVRGLGVRGAVLAELGTQGACLGLVALLDGLDAFFRLLLDNFCSFLQLLGCLVRSRLHVLCSFLLNHYHLGFQPYDQGRQRSGRPQLGLPRAVHLRAGCLELGHAGREGLSHVLLLDHGLHQKHQVALSAILEVLVQVLVGWHHLAADAPEAARSLPLGASLQAMHQVLVSTHLLAALPARQSLVRADLVVCLQCLRGAALCATLVGAQDWSEFALVVLLHVTATQLRVEPPDGEHGIRFAFYRWESCVYLLYPRREVRLLGVRLLEGLRHPRRHPSVRAHVAADQNLDRVLFANGGVLHEDLLLGEALQQLALELDQRGLAPLVV